MPFHHITAPPVQLSGQDAQQQLRDKLLLRVASTSRLVSLRPAALVRASRVHAKHYIMCSRALETSRPSPVAAPIISFPLHFVHPSPVVIRPMESHRSVVEGHAKLRLCVRPEC
jgi:hypothetical protein